MKSGVFSILFFYFTQSAILCHPYVYYFVDNQYQSLSNSTSEDWFHYTTQYFKKVNEQGIYADYANVISNADEGLKLISLAEDYDKAATYYFQKGYAYKVQLQHDTALKYLNECIKYSSLANSIDLEVKAITQINYLLRFLGRNNETEPYIKRLSILLLDKNNHKYREVILTSLAEAYLFNGNYNKAVRIILPLLPIKKRRFEKDSTHVNRISLGNAYANAGNMYVQLGQYSKAQHYLNLAIPLFHDYIGATVRVRNILMQLFVNREELDSARAQYQSIYAANRDRNKFYESAELSNANRILAEYYLKKKNYEQLNLYAKRSQYFANQSERPETILKNNKLFASINFDKGQYQNVIGYIEKDLPKALAFSRDFYHEILMLLANSYEELKNYEKSLAYFKMYSQSTSKLFEEKSNEEILDVEIKYQTQEKQKEIDNLHVQQQLTNNLIKSKNQLQYILIVVLLLLIAVASLIYKNYNTKKSANNLLEKKYKELEILSERLMEANTTKAKLFSIISHDLRSPVSELFSFLKLQESTLQSKDYNETKAYQARLLNSSSKLLDTMEDILIWSKSQMDRFEVDNDEISIADLLANLVALLEIQLVYKNLKIDIMSSELEFVISDYNMLHTILRNLLQNAIANSPKNSVIKIQTQANPVKCILISNHIENTTLLDIKLVSNKYYLDSQSNGLGLVIVKELIDLLGFEIHFEQVENNFEVKVVFS